MDLLFVCLLQRFPAEALHCSAVKQWHTVVLSWYLWQFHRRQRWEFSFFCFGAALSQHGLLSDWLMDHFYIYIYICILYSTIISSSALQQHQDQDQECLFTEMKNLYFCLPGCIIKKNAFCVQGSLAVIRECCCILTFKLPVSSDSSLCHQ